MKRTLALFACVVAAALFAASPAAAQRSSTDGAIDPRYVDEVVLEGSADEPTDEEIEVYLRRVMAASEAAYRGEGFWGKGLAGRGEVEFLQYNSRFLLGLEAAAEAGFEHPRLLDRIDEGAAFLIRTQGPSGMIPHPNEAKLGRGKHQSKITAGLERGQLRARGKWLIDAREEMAASASIAQGNGARALVGAQRLLSDTSFGSAAISVADWVLSRHRTHPNVNFNSFAVGALVAGHTAGGRDELLTRAVELTEEAILPSQLDSGRWRDAHNGLLNYHSIILHHLVQLYAALPSDAKICPRLKEASAAAAGYLVDHVHGRSLYTKPTNLLTDAIVALIAYDRVFGLDPEGIAALNILVNSRPPADVVERMAPRSIQAYSETMYGMGEYLRWRTDLIARR